MLGERSTITTIVPGCDRFQLGPPAAIAKRITPNPSHHLDRLGIAICRNLAIKKVTRTRASAIHPGIGEDKVSAKAAGINLDYNAA